VISLAPLLGVAHQERRDVESQQRAGGRDGNEGDDEVRTLLRWDIVIVVLDANLDTWRQGDDSLLSSLG
jgi:hypothetical protein